MGDAADRYTEAGTREEYFEKVRYRVSVSS
jgi:hypothetical protein